MKNQTNLKLLLAGTAAICAIFLLVHLAAGQRAAGDGTPAPLGAPQEQPAAAGSLMAASALTTTSCRYGVGLIYDSYTALPWAQTLNAGWYANFGAQRFSGDGRKVDYAPILRLKQNRDGNGNWLPTYAFNPPLVEQYVGGNGQVQAGLGRIVADNPGQLWMIGNEVDVDNVVQDRMMPQLYAQAYHEAYYFIKRVDPSAKIAIAGLSMMTPGRLQYLTIVWDTYRALYGVDMPVDVWNMHLYILEERDPRNPNEYGDGKIALGTNPELAKLSSQAEPSLCPNPATPNIDPRPDVNCRSEHDSLPIFREQIESMRSWMKARGQQNKPLIVSEFGLLYPYLDEYNNPLPGGQCDFLQDEFGNCFDPTRVTNYLNGTISYMETTTNASLGYPADGNRLVQQWLWYSVITRPTWSGGSSNLIAHNYANYTPGDPAALTAMGQRYRQMAGAATGTFNLVGGIARDAAATIDPVTFKAGVDLVASFRNDGIMSVVAPFQVTFYSDPGLTTVIGSTIYDPNSDGVVAGCTWDGRNSNRAAIRWNDLAAGTYHYWAVIDSANAIAEPIETDNTTTMGTVTIYPHGVDIPVVYR